MLKFIGLGLYDEYGMSLRGVQETKSSSQVFAEFYTNIVPGLNLSNLEKLIGKKIQILNREQVEIERAFFKNAKTKKVALLINGDVLSATTHSEIIQQATKQKVKIELMHGPSIMTAVADTGLSLYKFGKTASIPFWENNFKPESFFDIFVDNHNIDAHTLFLFDLRHEQNRFISSKQAIQVLERSMEINGTTDQERLEIDNLVKGMPDDRVLLYKNVTSNPRGDLPRYSIHIRIQHLIVFTTFLTLAFTGLPIAFIDHFWAVPINELVGGVNISRLLHRTLAATMIFGMVYHIVTVIIGPLKKILAGKFELQRTVIPTFKDLKDFKEDALYFAGKIKNRPMMDKFMYKQKLHYFAAGFGNIAMIISGSIDMVAKMECALMGCDYADRRVGNEQ